MSKQHHAAHHHAKKHHQPKKHGKGKGKHGQGAGNGLGGMQMGHGPAARAPGAPPPSAHTKAKHPKHTKAHKLAIGDAIACCAAEALAATLRLAGQPVTGDQVLELYWLTAGDEDAGAPIAVTLAAAAEHGLAGYRPIFEEVMPSAPAGRDTSCPLDGLRASRAGQLILGLELPGPHAVAVDHRGGWWSWGRRWDPSAFPAAVAEEAWAVSWS